VVKIMGISGLILCWVSSAHDRRFVWRYRVARCKRNVLISKGRRSNLIADPSAFTGARDS
jgi:hypothetical protein